MINYFQINASDIGTPIEPVSLADAKAFMGVDYADDDILITSLIKSSRKLIEKRLNKALVAKNVTLYVTTSVSQEPVLIPYSTNVSSVVVSDLEQGSLPLATDEYTITSSLLRINYRGSYQLTWTETPVVDEDIKEAIKMLVAYRYNNRGDQEKQTGIPEDVEAIIDQNRAIVL